MKQLPHTRSCFVCGEANPAGMNLRFETDGSRVFAQFVPHPHHVGFRETMHGGLIATVLDEIMVWACAVATGRFAYCAELNVRFLHPVRPDLLVRGVATLVENRRDRIYQAKGELLAPDDTVLAAATGKYLPIPGKTAADMATDFVDDASWVFARPDRGT